MWYTSRDYRAEQEDREKRDEDRRKQEADKARRPEKVETPERERELVRG